MNNYHTPYFSVVVAHAVLTQGPSQSRGVATLVATQRDIHVTLHVSHVSSDIISAHLHFGNALGPIVLDLAPLTNKTTFTVADLVGPCKGIPMDLFLSMVSNQQLVANVHTVQYPQGEISGRLKISEILI